MCVCVCVCAAVWGHSFCRPGCARRGYPSSHFSFLWFSVNRVGGGGAVDFPFFTAMRLV